MTSDRVSNERLAEMLADAQSEAARKPRDETVYDFTPEEAVSALTELQHLGSPVTVSDGEVDFAKHIAAAIKAATEDGAACGWTPCSGCYETEVGYPVGTYPHSKMFGCDVGSGCDECGGLGVTWEYWSTKDLAEMAREPAITAALAPAEQEGHQQRVAAWMQECFGPEITADKVERTDRFIEEALELAQATGWTADRGHALVDYVFGRPVGEIGQEVGGVMVTLAALCNVFDIDMNAEAKREVDRITQPEIVLKIRAKQAAKPTGSALPASPTHPGGDSRVVAWRWPEPVKAGWNIHSVTSVEPPVSGWQPLVPLSSLEAVERERDEARQMCAKLLYAGQEDLILLQEVAGTVTSLSTRAETAEASLAAAREALKPFAAIAEDYSEAEDDSFQVWTDFDILGSSLPLSIFRSARAALAGSNGE